MLCVLADEYLTSIVPHTLADTFDVGFFLDNARAVVQEQHDQVVKA